jgi:hypothetical protein
LDDVNNMNKALIGIGTAALVLLLVAGNASAGGVCVGICVGGNVTPDVNTVTNTQVNSEACVGNVIVQVGISVTNNMCNGNQTATNCSINGKGDVHCGPKSY